ncbi:hypothetical protein JWZ98_11185 [Methylomonas sp. EFPC1]|uniref:hypothetical protein n=1 Tax=Methylomonas sp. EFPC1 TaxID=2812647 RepID=UPI0019680D74|nr:hypothetical protein [Methylomonas sp. EFPC1]QSB03440.1 hypothetical protein JWZ98_11185 [Methylomonas sp. EFPC1]
MNNWQARVDSNYQRIKAYYEGRGGTRWQDVTADPRFFNRVWRNMLRLPKGDNPPPKEYR